MSVSSATFTGDVGPLDSPAATGGTVGGTWTSSFTDEYTRRCIESVFWTDVVIQSCVSFLRRNLFTNPLSVVDVGARGKRKRGGGAGNRMDPGFEKFIRDKYHPFVVDVLNDLLCYGYFVWSIVEDIVLDKMGVKRKLRYPIVVSHGRYRIRTVQMKRTGRVRRLVYSNDRKLGPKIGKPDPMLHLIVLNGRCPEPESGGFRSHIAPLLKHFSYVNQMMTNVVHSEYQRAHPTVFLEQNTGATSDADLPEAVSADLRSAEMTGSAREQEEQRTADAVRRERNRVRRHAELLNGGQLTKVTDPHSTDGERPVATMTDSVFSVPKGQRVAQQPTLPPRGENVLDWESGRLEHICGALGIPTAMTSSGHRSQQQGAGKADNGDFRQVNHTALEWKVLLVRTCKIVFEEILEDAGMRVGDLGFEFEMDTVPFTDSIMLLQMMDLDIINDDAGKRHLLSIHGLNERDALTAGETNSHERTMPWSTERSTGPISKALARNTNAEATLREAETALKAAQAKVEAAQVKLLTAQVEESAAKAHALRNPPAAATSSKPVKKS